MWDAFAVHSQLKQCFLRKTMSPQPSSFVGYIENYGIKLWRPFKQQYSLGRNGHRPKWLWAEMVMDRNGYGPKWPRTFIKYEPWRQKTNIMHMRKQRREADQLLRFR